MANTKDEVNGMSARDRLWDSLNYSYGQKAQQSNSSYDKAISQQDQALLGRGMQRSSYGMQTLQGLRNQKVKAANDIESEKIADYENRLYQLERDEKADEQWEKQFGETQKQNEWSRNFQESEAERNQKNTEWEQAFQQGQFDYQKQRDIVSDEQWKQQFDFNSKTADQQIAMQYAMSIIQNGGDPSDDLLARAGLSRGDANSMKAQARGGRGGYTKPKDGTGDDTDTGGGNWDEELFTDFWSNYGKNHVYVGGAKQKEAKVKKT